MLLVSIHTFLNSKENFKINLTYDQPISLQTVREPEKPSNLDPMFGRPSSACHEPGQRGE
jgi:hypothetical protein